MAAAASDESGSKLTSTVTTHTNLNTNNGTGVNDLSSIINVAGTGESIEELTKEVEMLKLKLEEERAKFNDVELHVVAQKLETISNFLLKPRRVLKGHQGKVLALDWSSDKRHIASTSQVSFQI
jgi:predicted DNA-binding ArsR family transcriptional regulator